MIGFIASHSVAVVQNFEETKYRDHYIHDEYKNTEQRAIRILDILYQSDILISAFLKNLQSIQTGATLVKEMKQQFGIESNINQN